MDLTQGNTLLDLQHRPNELGRIRLGAKAVTKGGKEYPTTLDTWRLTSGSLTLLDAAARAVRRDPGGLGRRPRRGLLPTPHRVVRVAGAHPASAPHGQPVIRAMAGRDVYAPL